MFSTLKISLVLIEITFSNCSLSKKSFPEKIISLINGNSSTSII